MILRPLLAAALLVSCAPRAVKEPPPLSLPAAFGDSATGPTAASIDWRTFFADDNLNNLVTEALSHNFDVQIALQRIELARAGVLQSTGTRLPQLSLVAQAGVQKFGRYTMDGAGNATTEITPGRLIPQHLPDLFIGVQASWEADIWSRLRHLRGGARARYLASLEGTHAVTTNLVAEVAVRYFELLALDETQRVLAETLARQTQALEVMRIEKQAGRTNELAIQQFEAQLADVSTLSAQTIERTRATEGELDLLLGRTPRAIPRTPTLLYREAPVTLATGVPGDLLRNRPDVRAAELAVQATRFDVAAARAAFMPRLQMTAGAGFEAFNPRFLLETPESIVYNVVGGLIAPLVNRRGIEAAFHAATATQLTAMYTYQSVVLRSFIEVSTGLTQMQQRAAVVTQRKRKREALANAVDTADALFRAGKASYLEVLLAQQKTLDAELDLITALRDQHIAGVRLYKALGGGWRAHP
jgi:NodT family efflux transporter outer membrane factor (OMF) lipoprotein